MIVVFRLGFFSMAHEVFRIINERLYSIAAG